MRQISNAHTHSTWCDGRDTPRQLAEQALALGFTDLGFSSHGPAPFDFDFPGILGKEADYKADIRALAREYTGKLNILCGVEEDVFAPVDRNAYDYVITSVHYLPVGGPNWRTIDDTPEKLRALTHEYYGGDGLKMATGYFSEVAKMTAQIKPQIIGHFDLVTKYNGVGGFFDENSAAYQNIALEAFDETLGVIRGYGGIVEVNTGAMARGWRTVPYPAPFLLKHAAQKGARMLITTDCHDRAKLDYGYDGALALLRDAGFGSMVVLQNGRFEEVKI